MGVHGTVVTTSEVASTPSDVAFTTSDVVESPSVSCETASAVFGSLLVSLPFSSGLVVTLDDSFDVEGAGAALSSVFGLSSCVVSLRASVAAEPDVAATSVDSDVSLVAATSVDSDVSLVAATSVEKSPVQPGGATVEPLVGWPPISPVSGSWSFGKLHPTANRVTSSGVVVN